MFTKSAKRFLAACCYGTDQIFDTVASLMLTWKNIYTVFYVLRKPYKRIPAIAAHLIAFINNEYRTKSTGHDNQAKQLSYLPIVKFFIKTFVW